MEAQQQQQQQQQAAAAKSAPEEGNDGLPEMRSVRSLPTIASADLTTPRNLIEVSAWMRHHAEGHLGQAAGSQIISLPGKGSLGAPLAGKALSGKALSGKMLSGKSSLSGRASAISNKDSMLSNRDSVLSKKGSLLSNRASSVPSIISRGSNSNTARCAPRVACSSLTWRIEATAVQASTSAAPTQHKQAQAIEVLYLDDAPTTRKSSEKLYVTCTTPHDRRAASWHLCVMRLARVIE